MQGMSNLFFIMYQIINLSLFGRPQKYIYMIFPPFSIRCLDQMMSVKNINLQLTNYEFKWNVKILNHYIIGIKDINLK